MDQYSNNGKKDFKKVLPDHMEQKMKIPWTRERDKVWNDLEMQVDNTARSAIRLNRNQWTRLAVAASLVLLLALAGVLRFYRYTVESLPGEHISMALPDGSRVELNAGSELNYHPYWWRFSRRLTLKGEAHFEVRKGKKFEVVSEFGVTRVRGTTFNIFARENQYKVACISGSVEVVSRKEKDAVILNSNQMAVLEESGMFRVQDTESNTQPSAWRQNNFIFTAVLLTDVFKEMERQYNISISIPGDLDYFYTGNFERRENVEEVLNLICKPFGLVFEEETEGHYKIRNK